MDKNYNLWKNAMNGAVVNLFMKLRENKQEFRLLVEESKSNQVGLS